MRHAIDLVADKHGPKMLALTPEERSWILKVHKHPNASKLKLFCQQMGCQPHIIDALEDIRCSTCLETKSPEIARPSAIHSSLDFGDVVGMDGVKWPNKEGRQFFFYHFADQGTTFHAATLAASHSTQDAIPALTQGWRSWAGPPGTLVVDAGAEFGTEGFHSFLQEHDVKLRVIAPEAHWQNARVERHGGILQAILSKMDQEKPIQTTEDMETALSFATQTKNKWSRHKGYPPELLVFGKLNKGPGSIASDSSNASLDLALQESPEGIQFREKLAIRERARKAFSEVDNSQALRRALHQRSRPQRSVFHPGDWIMAWRKDSQWFGPLKVIVQEDKNVIWAVLGNKLFRIAPEHVRPLSAVEEVQQSKTSDSVDVKTMLEQLRSGNARYIDLPFETESPMNRPNESVNEESSSEQPDLEPEIIEKEDKSFSSSEAEYTPSVAPEAPVDPQPNTETNAPEVPENIPVPSDDDDELFGEAFVLEEDQGWKLEIDLNQNDINMLRQDPNPCECAFLVSAAKKQKTEVKLSTLSPVERKLFEDAKEKELQSWMDTQTICRILRHQIPEKNVLRCRWILTWKDAENNTHLNADGKRSENRKAKARLVILGYQDPELSSLERDSPTLSKLSRNLLLQTCVTNRWEIGSFDIKTAFLRGRADARLLGLEPPPELRAKLGLRPTEICRLLKGAYGLVNAPLLWFKELSKALEKLGFEAFVLFDDNHKARRFIGVHVDDGLFAGDTVFHQKINQLEQVFPFGSRKARNFVFTGLQIHQYDDFSITVDQTQYVKDINPISIHKDQRKLVDAPISEEERQALRGLVGSLQYASVNARPDLGSRLSFLQGKINNGQVGDLIEGNKLLHDAKVNAEVRCRYQYIPRDEVRFVAFSDASFNRRIKD